METTKKEIQHFFSALQKDYKNIEQLQVAMEPVLTGILQDYPVTDINLRYIDNSSNQPKEVVFYHSEKNQGLILIREYQDSLVITAHISSGASYTTEQEFCLKMVLQNLLLMCSRILMQEVIRQNKNTDTLTQMRNRDGFQDYGRQLKKSGLLHDYSCMMINIKNFNYVNQTAGSEVGNLVLRSYAKAMQDQLGNNGIVSRMGGDTFGVLLLSREKGRFLDFLEKVTIQVFQLETPRKFDLRCRIGICDGAEKNDITALINCANVAINVARENGKSDVITFNESMMVSSLHSKEISLIYPQAMADREFIVYYQPKVFLLNNQLCGCEALVRWKRNGEILPPSEFVPILEAEGTICSLDFYVLEQVCKDLRHWLDLEITPVRVSVNFSRLHLFHSNVAREIINILNRYEIPTKYIEVELTETCGYENFETMLGFVKQLRQYGISTSVDDFGTGYSSLTLLKNMDVDVVKLDKSFLDNVHEDEKKDTDFIRNIVSMVKELNMDVIAEGVETPQQADFLREVDCCMAQGFLFDKPLPMHEFEKRLIAQSEKRQNA